MSALSSQDDELLVSQEELKMLLDVKATYLKGQGSYKWMPSDFPVQPANGVNLQICKILCYWSSNNGGFAAGLVTLPRKIKVLISKEAQPWILILVF